MERINHHGYYGDPPRYVYYPEPAFVRDGQALPYYGAVPVTFREPPFYDDGFVRDFRRHQPDFGRPGHLPPEQVLVRRDVDENTGAGRPWWRNPDFPHGGHDGHRIFIVEPDSDSEQTVELYVPQLCCDNCERRVKDYLIDSPGVESVTADQWEKKVVVVGTCNLRPHDLLRSLQRHLDMPRSTFWEHRSC